jgi:hypothetical protein
MVDEKQVCDINRITAVMIYEMDIITSIAESQIKRAMILVIL